MFAFVVRRIIQAFIVVIVISLVVFAIQQKIGDPVRDMVGISVSVKEREELRDKLGLNDPYWAQYFRFLKNAAGGDLGRSFIFNESALKVIIRKAPATLELVFASSLIIVLVSVPVGIFAAIKPKNFFSRLCMGTSVIGVSIPVFLIAIGLIYFFSVYLGWLPSYGRGQTVNVRGWESGMLTLDGLKHLVLPSIALSSIMLPLFIRLIRSEMMEVMESEYVKFAYAKGLGPWRVWMVHAFKNTLLPVVSVGGVQLGILIAFTIMTETVFQWQGMGYIFLEAVSRSDTSLLTAYMMVVGVLFVVINSVVDLLYGLINPTIRITGRK